MRKASIHRIYRILIRELDLTVDSYNPISFISRIVTRIGSSEKTKRDAIKILTKAEELMITAGKNPMAVAATVTYLAAIKNGESITQTKLSNESEISIVTIRNLCRVLRNAKISSLCDPIIQKELSK